jgi:hypothetical protein
MAGAQHGMCELAFTVTKVAGVRFPADLIALLRRAVSTSLYPQLSLLGRHEEQSVCFDSH